MNATMWQTVGPYFCLGFGWLFRSTLVPVCTSGRRITVTGRILDGMSNPIPDAVIEIWQANSHGKYAHASDTQNKPLDRDFCGFGRIPTGADGQFKFTTIQPGRVPGPGGMDQAPHLLIGLLMRGLLRRLTTRIYFPDEPANEDDPILKLVAPERRKTLLLKAIPDQPNSFRWDIRMQGKRETVFLDF